MTKQNKLSFNLFYKILLSVSIIIAGISLICGCINIYLSGNGYSRQIVSDTFSKICIPIYICLALIVGNFIINIFLKENKIKTKFYKPKNFNQNQPEKLSAKKLFAIKIILILIATVLLVFGALTGGFADVLTKAINICTECIGLG